MQLVNYQSKIDALDSPEFAKSGYRVKLERGTSNIVVILFYGDKEVGRKGTSFTKQGYRGARENRTYDEILTAVRWDAICLYNGHNQTLKNPDLLKALEDRLNGESGMLVLTPGVGPAEDSKPTATITAGRIDTTAVRLTPEAVQHVEYDPVLDAMKVVTTTREVISRQVWDERQ